MFVSTTIANSRYRVFLAALFALCALNVFAPSQCLGQASPTANSPAQVEPAPAGESASEHLSRSVQHFKNQEFLQAAEELRTAYAIEPKPLLLFNIGQAYRRANRPKEALEAYERFMREDPQSTLRPETEGYCNDMRSLITEQERKAQIESALATEQQRAQERDRALKQEQARTAQTQQDLTLERQKAERERKRPLYRRPWFWGVLGAAVVTAGVVVALGVTLAPHDRQTDGGFVEVNFALSH